MFDHTLALVVSAASLWQSIGIFVTVYASEQDMDFTAGIFFFFFNKTAADTKKSLFFASK